MPLKEIDRDVEVLTASALLSRLWHIEADIKYMKENIEDLDNSYHDIETNVDNIEADVEGLDRACSDRLDKIDSEIRVMFKIVSENHLALMKIEKRIAIMQEKIDGID